MLTIATTSRITRRSLGWGWIVLSAAAIAVLAPLPYLTGSLDALAEGNSRLAANYADRPMWAQLAFYTHVGFGGLALLLSPVQLATRLRKRAPQVHRTVGRIVLVGVGLAGSAGLVLAPLNLAGIVGTAGFGTLAALWICFGAGAYRAIRRGDVTAHRRWALRTFALTYAAVTLRLWLGLLIPLQISIGGVNEDTAFSRAYHLVPFLCWLPNLLVTELILRRGTPAGETSEGGRPAEPGTRPRTGPEVEPPARGRPHRA